MKRLLTVLLCILLLVGMLTGCGGGGENSSLVSAPVLPELPSTTAGDTTGTTTGTTAVTPTVPTGVNTGETTRPTQKQPAEETTPSMPYYDSRYFMAPVLTDMSKGSVLLGGKAITNACATIGTDVSAAAKQLGNEFAAEIAGNIISNFAKPGDKMVHVTSYTVIDNMIYMTYYANVMAAQENPEFQRARLVYCPADDVNNKTYIDLQAAGDTFGGKTVNAVYDTILLTTDNKTLFLLWTASLDGNYYRLYRTFDVATKQLGPVKVNHLTIGKTKADFNVTNIMNMCTNEGVPMRGMYSDIGIMQKLTSRVENGVTYYYTGAYCGNFNFIIKSRDLINWEYVSQPSFDNDSQWENATYVIGDRVYYFVRQATRSDYGFLTYYDLVKKTWADPVLVADCQSRSDFIMHNGELYLFYAPISRNHIGVLHINQQDLSQTKVVFQARMKESCFYPFIQWCEGQMYFSYTCGRWKVPLSKFDADKYLVPQF